MRFRDSRNRAGDIVIRFAAIALVALPACAFAARADSTVQLPGAVHNIDARLTYIKMPQDGGGLTLYNTKGEIVARCNRKGDSFANCKVEHGFTFDDVMNAWVRAYQDLEK